MLFGYATFILDALYARLFERPRVHAALGVLIALFVLALLLPSPSFPSGTSIEIRSNESFGVAANELADAHVIVSASLLKALARVTMSDSAVKAGRYTFNTPEGVAVILYRLVNGVTETPLARVTFPEGITARDMGEILASSTLGFDEKAFIAEAAPYEGYLFPDTYDFPLDATPEEVVERMRARFDEVYEEVREDAERMPPGTVVRGDSEKRIVTMASILEKETKVNDDRRTVSGILWHRADIGMGLQVDAVFGYIKGIDTYHPSGKDLEIDSPYNTYKYKDLPPGPIGNPGRDALSAALMPTTSKYLYYLYGNDEKMHYAETFDEHKKNKELYLR